MGVQGADGILEESNGILAVSGEGLQLLSRGGDKKDSLLDADVSSYELPHVNRYPAVSLSAVVLPGNSGCLQKQLPPGPGLGFSGTPQPGQRGCQKQMTDGGCQQREAWGGDALQPGLEISVRTSPR